MKDEALSFAQACTRLDLDAHETAFFTADDDEVPGLEHSARLRDLAQSIHRTVALGESKPNEVYSEPLEEDAGTVLWMLAETRLPDEQTVAREQARFAESVVRRSLQTHAYFEWYLALDEDAAIFDIQYEKQLAELKAQQTRGTGGR
jgi:hypothetical protein